jgi:hypothetical protein
MKNLKSFADYLIKGGFSKEEGYKILLETTKLDRDEKTLLYSYCYPRKILDYELPNIIMSNRSTLGINPGGTLENNLGESKILVEAFRSQQYGRFMRHLMHAFLNPELLSSVSGTGEERCPICGKKIFYTDSWNGLTDPGQETLAIMSKESSVCLCKDCLVQLLYSYELISSIEGPEFLVPKWQNSVEKV